MQINQNREWRKIYSNNFENKLSSSDHNQILNIKQQIADKKRKLVEAGLANCAVRPTDIHIGYFKSNGARNGKPVFQGPRGGLYIVNDSGNLEYLTESEKLNSIIFKI